MIFRKRKVVFYCPDTHVVADGRTPYTIGIGGGISARIRMARALSRLGNKVSIVTNCEEHEVVDGVEYVPLQACDSIKGDVIVATTSGGELSLKPLLELDIQTSVCIVWVHGITKPAALDEIPYDSVCCVSNFIGDIARAEWGVPQDRIFVGYNAFEEDVFSRAEKSNPSRDPFRLIYFSHPTKGLDTALEVLQILRSRDSKYHLEVFGGRALWGEEDSLKPDIEGVSFRGMIAQEALAFELMKSTYSMQMQDREEPGALAIVDARRAGCIIIGSSVGCYPEMVEDGESGFLLPGDHRADDIRKQAAAIILDLAQRPDELQRIREKARSVKWSSDRKARTWLGHWDWLDSRDGAIKKTSSHAVDKYCDKCGGALLNLADGEHCVGCGQYYRVCRK